MLPLKYSVKNVFARPVTTGMTVLAIALLTGVTVAINALGAGMDSALKRTGDPRTIIVMRPGAESEGQSSLAMPAFDAAAAVAGIDKTPDGRPLASPEVIVAMFLPRADGKRSNVMIRGVQPIGFEARPDLKVLPGGRLPRPGVAELVVGKRLAERFPQLGLGKTVDLGRRDYPVVGLFESSAGSTESEVFGDADAIMGDFQRGGYSAARVRVAPGADAEKVRDEIKADKRYKLEAKTETEYLAAQALSAQLIYALGAFVSFILVFGAIFATMNTLYAAVAARGREIATLRALGFGRLTILLAIMIESAVLSFLGWAVAIAATKLGIDGLSTGTTNFVTFSEMSFDFRVDAGVAITALIFTMLIALAGGLLPAVRATRTPVSMALRQV